MGKVRHAELKRHAYGEVWRALEARALGSVTVPRVDALCRTGGVRLAQNASCLILKSM